MFYDNGEPIIVGNKVKLSNGEYGTVVATCANVDYVFGSDLDPFGKPGVLVVTIQGARVIFLAPDSNDFTRA
jgi:hypothetical protein